MCGPSTGGLILREHWCFARPVIVFGIGLAADVPSHIGVCPHRGATDEIVDPMAAEFEPLGFEDRYFYSGRKRAKHRSSLGIRERRGKWEALRTGNDF
jgi:hypothetical protein